MRPSSSLCHMESVAQTWFEVIVEVPAGGADSVANFLIENGAPGVQIQEHDGRAVLTAHFAGAPPLQGLRRYCADIGCNWSAPARIDVRETASEDWEHNWKLHFQPQPLGQHLYICPPWAVEAPPGRIAVVINPGMAFGTGQHASTRGCLHLLDDMAGEREIGRALDVGTGSGVLAIALAKLGSPAVWAIDTDRNACAIAAENVARNHVEAHVRIGSALNEVEGTFDIITANLFANLLQELAPRLAGLVRRDGVLICSGFLDADEPAVRQAYGGLGFQVYGRYEELPWVTLSLRRAVGT